MAFIWNYIREEKTNRAGDYRFEVVNAEEKTSNSGKNMIVVELKLNPINITVKDYFVEGDYFNRKATQFFDSTNIEEGNFELLTWIGATGAARFKEDEYGFLKVAYYLDPARAAKLPEWEGPIPERQTVTKFEELDPDDDLPF